MSMPYTYGPPRAVQADEEPIPRQKFKDPSWMTRNIGRKIYWIAHWEVKANPHKVTSSDGYEFLCSYSWKNTALPSIYVPGVPRVWDPPLTPKQLPKDKGNSWCDQHGHRVPKFQFEPVFQALATMNKLIRFDNVDIVVNRNTLQKLFSFASYRRGEQFHADLNMVGKTLFIGRKERSARVHTDGGFGRSFEEVFTSGYNDFADADGHHRVIRYKLGSLNMVVRIEADGYLPLADPNIHPPTEYFANVFHAIKGNRTISHKAARHTTAIAGGFIVPHNQTLELKSGHAPGNFMEQLWFGRCPNACFGNQKQGMVTTPKLTRYSKEDFGAWEAKHQFQLQKLVWFLEELRRVTERSAGRAAVLVAIEKGAPLQVFEQKVRSGALPQEIVNRFWDRAV